MADIEVVPDTVTTMNHSAVVEPVVEPVVTPTPEPVIEQPKEKSTQEALDEVIQKVKARDAKKADKTPADPAAAAAKPDDKGTKTPPGAPVEPAKVAYTPNFKFKASTFDEKAKDYVQKEFEIPKELQAIIKDEKSEKLVKELCERSYGLDKVKEERANAIKERETVLGENTQIKGSINNLRSMYQRGDMDSFFAALKIPPERVLQYALEKAEYLELTPEQRAVIDAKKNAERKAFELENQNQTLSGTLQEQISTAKRVMLEAVLTRPDISAVAQSFDTRAGRPGAFRQAIADHGELTWIRSQGKIDLTPEQAASQVMEMYGLKPGEQPAPAATPVAVQPVVPPAATQAAPRTPAPTIPNFQGSGNSPVGKAKPKNIDDLIKIRQEKFG